MKNIQKLTSQNDEVKRGRTDTQQFLLRREDDSRVGQTSNQDRWQSEKLLTPTEGMKKKENSAQLLLQLLHVRKLYGIERAMAARASLTTITRKTRTCSL